MMISLSNGLLSLNGGGLDPPAERRRSQETVSLNGGVRTPPLSDGSLKAWAGSGPGLGQAFFLYSSPSSPQCRLGLVNPEAEGRH